MKFDVAIIGAGPAGSWLARELAKNKISVVLFERSPVLGEPNFSSGGSPAYTVERFNLPREAVAAEWDAIKFIGPNLEKEWRFGKVVGVVLDFRKLKKLLIEEAIKNGAEVVLGMAVESIENRGGYSYVLAKSLKEDYGAKIIVDASGPAGVIAVSTGIRKKIPVLPAVGIEVIVEVDFLPKEDSRTLAFFLGNDLAPHGYGWIFPMQPPQMKVGIIVYQLARYKGMENLDILLDKFLQKIPGAGNAKIIEKHGGSVWGTGGIRNHVRGNVIAIGDAADQINPLGEEGIRHALQSAEFAGKVIIEALRADDLKLLNRYNNLWNNYVGWKWKMCALISKIFYVRFFSWKLSDRVVRLISKLTPEELFDVLFEYRVGPVIRALFR